MVSRIFTVLVIIILALSISSGVNRGQVNNDASVKPPLPVGEMVSRSAAEMLNPNANAGRVSQANRVADQDPQSKLADLGSSDQLQVICQGHEASSFDCYKKHYEGLVKNGGVGSAFADLRQRYNENSYVVSQCHPITHVIGNSAIEKYPTASEAYTHGDSFCWSGYYHGVLEGILSRDGEEKTIAGINEICKDIPGRVSYSFDYYNCVHGIGHGLMAMTNTELFKSLNLCDRLTGDWERTSCYGGVYMENVIVDNKNHFTKYLKPEDPLYPCNEVGERYKSACYLMQTSYMLKVANGDFAKVFDLCAKADPSHVATCYQSLGRDASGRSVSDADTTKNTCYLGKSFEARSNCIIGAVKDFISYFHSDTQAKALCNRLTNNLKSVCLVTATEYYKTF